MQSGLVLLDSITEATRADEGQIAVSGSHGGYYAAVLASRGGLRAVVFNDAGRGLDDAGIAGLRALDRVGMAGIAVSTMSAAIGSAQDAWDNGVVSYSNATASKLGVCEASVLSAQFGVLSRADEPAGILGEVEEARWEVASGQSLVLCVDSASLIGAEDAGRVIVTGSHGGLIGGDPARACKAQAQLVAFNDAGGGKDDIGFSRLPALDSRGVAAVALDCHTCRIGDAASSLESGVISRANGLAQRLGARKGRSLKSIISEL
ncbi:hypothetical protein AB833_12950 [Chromatiales bacterium (ex Bugula neritina AB1)]|nr:hypothetical protein AB833_12950 [Chromatiales bacterium (ex Bugula neritina AB1)]